MGRPRLSAEQARSVMVITMIRPQEKVRLTQRAQQLDESQSATLRRALLQFLKQEPAAAAREEGK